MDAQVRLCQAINARPKATFIRLLRTDARELNRSINDLTDEIDRLRGRVKQLQGFKNRVDSNSYGWWEEQ